MRNRSPKIVLLSGLMAAAIGAGMFALALSRRSERRAGSDEITFNIGAERERMAKLIAQRRAISEREAQEYLKQLEERKRLRVLNKFSLPNGTLADFVKVSGGKRPVKKQGSGLLLNPDSELGRRYYEQVVGQEGSAAHKYFQQKWNEAQKKGFFNWTMTQEQRDRLLRLSKGESISATTRSRQTPVALRTLVVAVEFPQWVDAPPQFSTQNLQVYYRTTGQPGGTRYFHPISDQNLNGMPDRFEGLPPIGETPGGRIIPTFNQANNLSDFTLGAVTWGSQTHPGVRGQNYPQSVDMREQWYSLLFDPANANSVVNYYWQNSHGHVRLSGDRSDIVGWLESRHPLDRTDIAPQTAPFYAFQPGTPLIRPIPEPTGEPVLAYGTVNTTADPASTPVMVNSWITLVWSRSVYDIPGASSSFFYNIESPTGRPLPLGTSRLRLRVDPFDSRRVVMLIAAGGTAVGPYWGRDWQVTFDNSWFGGNVTQSISGWVDWGVTLNNTRFASADVLQTTGPTDAANVQMPLTPHRLKSYCYYTTDPEFRAGDPYQLQRLRNRQNQWDDIGGDVENANDRRARPAPYDHDLEDHNRPTGGLLGWYPHDVDGVKEDVNFLLADNGIDVTQYDRVIYVYPDGGSPGIAANGSFYDSSIMVPESAGLATVAATLGFTFGFPNLFDGDSGAGYNPPHRVTHAVGPYSLMSGAGIRLDPYCKSIAVPGPWINPIVVTNDRLGQRLPEVEGVYDESRVLSIPVPGATGEYFLVENHNRQLFGDFTPFGLTVYHVDPRYGIFYYPDLPPNSGGQNDDLWLVAVEQADGQYELERKLRAQPLTTLATDSFGADAGSTVTVWDQYSHDLAGNSTATSQSRGLADTSGNLLPGTAFDSYVRIAKVGNTGPVMTADIYVEPRELVVTGTPLASPTIPQGATNAAMLQLDFAHSALSTNDVTLDTLRFNESGSSKLDSDTTRVSLFDDSNGVSGFQPTATATASADRLVASSQFTNQQVTFTGLSYLVKNGDRRRLFVVLDVSDTMDTSAEATVGVQIADATDVRPQVPGAIQERAANGTFRFPIPQGNLASSKVVEAGDTLLVTPVNRSPASVTQGLQNVPMLSLNLSVNRDTVLITRLRVREDGTSDQDTDLLKVHLYSDPEQDGAVGLNDTLLASVPLSGQIADFQGISVVVAAGTPRSLLLTYDVSDFAQLGKTLTAALPDISYVTVGDAADTVSVANFPIASSPSLIERAAHLLYVSASSFVLPFVDPGDTDVPFEKLVLTPDAGVVTLSGLTIRQSGTGLVGAAADLKTIKVYRDTNQSGLLETTGPTPDALMVTGSTFVDTDTPTDGIADGVVFTTANGSFPSNFTINAGSSETLFVAVDVGDPGLATVGNTLELALVNAAAVNALPDTTILTTGSFPVRSGASVIRGLVDVVIGESVPDGTVVPQGAIEQFMMRLDVTAQNSNVTADTLVVGRGGSGTDADVLQVKAYLDKDADTVFNSSVDTLLGAAPFTSGQVIFSNLTLALPAGATTSIFIVYDLSGNATTNATLTAQLLSAVAISGPGVQVDPSVTFPLTSNQILIADAPPRLAYCEASKTQALVRFSEPVQTAEAEQAANLEIESPAGNLIHSAASPLSGLSLSYNAGIRSLVISGLSFTYGDEVKFTVSNVKDLAGNVIAPPNNTCTATVGETVPPAILSCVVSEPVTEDAGGTAAIVFTKDVIPTGAGGALGDLGNFLLVANGLPLNTSAASISFAAATRTTTITGLPVKQGDTYQITAKGITDIFGNAMEEDGSANVCSGTVQDAVAPTLLGIAAHAKAIVLTFSEAMDPKTISVPPLYAQYTVTEGGAAVALKSVSLSTDGTIATLVPTTDLSLSGTLTVVVRDVKDKAGRDISPNPTTAITGVGVQVVIPGHGLTLFAVPMLFTPPDDDPAFVLGDGAKVARFDPVFSQYQVYPTVKFGFAPGQGYWGRFNVDTPLLLSAGQLVSTLTPFTFNLPTNNWALFGNPFLGSLSWNMDALSVKVGGGVTTPLRQLVGSSNPVMETYAWAYDSLARDYYLVSDPRIIPGVKSVIPVGTAVWVKSNTANAALVVPAPLASRASVPVETETPGDNSWSVELVASAGDATDSGNLLGVSPGRAVTVASPPAQPELSDFVELSFLQPTGAGEGGFRGEVDLRSAVSSRASWEVEVRTDRAGSEVRVLWPELSRLPSRYRLRFVDPTTGSAVAMRTSRYYSFQAERSGITARRFRVELIPAEEGGLRISGVSVVPAGRASGGGLAVSYALSQDADVQVRVLSATGRQVGVLTRSSGRAGLNQVAWAARGADGRALPRGVYLVEITARDDEGQATRAVRTAPLR
ncbi:MAG: hypothetical protein AUJ96_23100 [Armatimonadetes bacterium CG2_30_66_41]|nr:MAG: hypothetical protein AUJ96_23100 [Armatimonadetes bacterium CG2_30_66_41]